MPGRSVRLLTTIGICSAFAFMLLTGAGAIDIETPHVTVPTPHVNVPPPRIKVPTVNLPQQSGTGSPGAKVYIEGGSSNSTGSPGAKVYIEGGSSNSPVTAPAGASSTSGSIPTVGLQPGNVDVTVKSGTSIANPPGFQPPPCPYADRGVCALTAGSENSSYAAVISADEANITAAQQAETLAGDCAVNPSSHPNCRSAEPVAVAQQNYTNAENELTAFEADVSYLLWLLAYMSEQGLPGDTASEAAAVETALTACLSSPSTCNATINALNLTLEEMGVQAEVVGPNGKVTLNLLTPSQILADWDPSNHPSTSETLSNYLTDLIGLAKKGSAIFSARSQNQYP